MSARSHSLRIEPVSMPDEDLSGEFGRRVLRLLARQVDRNLDVMGERGEGVRIQTSAPPDPRYLQYCLGNNALALGLLTTSGSEGAMLDASPDELRSTACDCLRTMVQTHPLGGGEEAWNAFSAGRFMYLLATSAALLGEALDDDTRELTGRVLATEADRFLGRPAPTQLRDDTQAESNAWHGGGIAAVACVLPDHPHRERWETKALEYTISAYATEADVISERVVDGRPLCEWLTGANALTDHTVENHGFVHPDYLVSISEMARAALVYSLVGRPIPEGLSFNAGAVFDRLAELTLPDTSHIYIQGTDYSARRIDGFWQACLIALMEPTPLRTALLLRSLDRLEVMAEQWPTLPMSAWLGLPCDLGATWGLTQNYLAARLFGVGEEAVEDRQIESALAGTHISEDGQFLVRRTAHSVTSFAWHSDEERAHVLGLSMPLESDTLCYPMQGSWFGDVQCAATAEDALTPGPCALRWREGTRLTMSLQRCGGRIAQHCAFSALEDGGGVFISELEALADVTLEQVRPGTIWLFDDVRWPWQDSPRQLIGASGALGEGEHMTVWVNVDDRLGWVALGAERCAVRAVAGRPAIFREEVPMYDTLRVDFVTSDGEGRLLSAGERCCRFAMLIRPGLTAGETEGIAREMCWLDNGPGTLSFEAAGRAFRATLADQGAEAWRCGVSED